MKSLVLGGEGFIGSNLKLDGWCYDTKHGDDIFAPKLEKYIKESEIVYHLAALTSVVNSFKNPQETFRTNVLGTARVVELCLKYKKKLIYPSSMAVYHPHLSPYAKSKWLAEQIVRGVMGKSPVVVLRLTNVFGEGMNPSSGSIMYNFLTADKLVVYGDGEQTRDYIHVRDVVSIMKDAQKKKWDNKVVEVGTGEAFSVNFVAGLFAFYRKKKLYYKPTRREVKWSVADATLLKTLYKKKLTTNIQDDIKELVDG